MRDIDHIIADYFSDQPLTEEEYAFLREWADQSEKNRRLFDALAQMQVMGEVYLGKYVRKVTPGGVLHEVNTKKRKRRLMRYASVAASFLLLIGVFWFVRFVAAPPGKEPFPVAQVIAPGTPKAILTTADGISYTLDSRDREIMQVDSVLQVSINHNTLVYTADGKAGVQRGEYNVLTVPPGAEYNLILADGTKVYLNSGSEIRYPAVFSRDKREVFFSGEAFFEVSSDARWPFMIETDCLTVQVTGTSFNLNTYPDRDVVATTLESGSVNIMVNEEVHNLEPGRQLLYNKLSKTIENKKVDTEQFTSWKDGYYYFEHMSLERIMENLALWYNLEVFYRDEEVKEMEFGARLKRYEDIHFLLRIMEETNDIGFEIKGKTITIYKK